MYEIKRSNQYEKNLKRQHKHDSNPDRCYVCGKVLEEPKYWLRIFYGLTVVTEAEAKELIARGDGSADLSYYPVGTDCLRKQQELISYAEDAALANLRFSNTEARQ